MTKDCLARWPFLACAILSFARSSVRFKARIVEWLQQVVESANLKSAQGVSVVGGDENNAGRIAAKHLDDVEAIEFGHLHVEKNEIGFHGADCRKRLATGAALGNYFDFRMAAKQRGEIGSGERFVVHNDGANFSDRVVCVVHWFIPAVGETT